VFVVAPGVRSQTSTPTAEQAAAAPPRLGWLDALRGFAALSVVLFHLSPHVIGSARHLAIFRHVDVGRYGVLLFFLVSGYVIPMSLERHGSLRRFWVGRLFRIYPAYLATVALIGVLTLAGLVTLPAALRADPVPGVLAHAGMLTDLLGVRGLVRVFWTLAYEMTFYLVVAGLFALRRHRHSGWWACGLALLGLAGPRLPDGLFAAHRTAAAVLLLVLLVAAITAGLTGRRRSAGLLGVVFVLLPAVDAHATAQSTVAGSWQGVQLLAVLFAGTVVYQAEHGQVGRRAAALTLFVVLGCLVVAHAAYAGGAVGATTLGAVAVTFAAAFALRGRDVPKVLTWLGAISYSLYLLHVVVLGQVTRLIPDLGARPAPVRLAAGVAFLLLALGCAALSHRWVELPAQALGRRILAARTITVATQRAVPRTARGDNADGSV
jgi:peptidoglycan/LPS O-acetylase OafA/YrhL